MDCNGICVSGFNIGFVGCQWDLSSKLLASGNMIFTIYTNTNHIDIETVTLYISLYDTDHIYIYIYMFSIIKFELYVK